ncbi:MAG: two-component system sensor histidine kinase NtrB [Brevinematia bacterium]
MENKFFYKFLENITRLDQENIKNILESFETERKIFKKILDLLEEAFIVMDEEKIFYLNQKAKYFLLASNLKLPVLFEEAFRFIGNKTIYDFLMMIKEKKDYEKTELIEHGKEDRYYEIESFFIENLYYIVKIKDVTEERKVKLQLKNIESVSALNTLAAGVAHEIKNPLTAIDLHTQIIMKMVKNGVKLPQEIIDYIKIIDEEQKRLGKIVNDFLLTTRKRELNLSFEDINKIIDETLELLEPELNDKKITLKKNFGGLPKIFVDKDYLKQAIINVIRNSIESLALKNAEEKLVKIDTFYEKNLDAIGIKVFDNGTGIEPEKLQKIFEPYYTTKDYGTGLGLTIVYKVIKEHGGDIKVESQKDEWTSFTLFIPIARGRKMIKND